MTTRRARLRTASAVALMAVSGCVGVTYQHPGQPITQHAGETLVLGRLRFIYDGREFFPWKATIVPPPERHVWLLRLGERAVSAELHPDEDGSLSVWLAGADYALLGTTKPVAEVPPAYEVVAIFRVPAGAGAADLGELTLETEFHEGRHVSHGEFGASSVEVQPVDSARAVLEKRFGTLPEPFVVSPWCAGDSLPGFDDPALANRATELLDRGCHAAQCVGRVSPVSSRAPSVILTVGAPGAIVKADRRGGSEGTIDEHHSYRRASPHPAH